MGGEIYPKLEFKESLKSKGSFCLKGGIYVAIRLISIYLPCKLQ